MDKIASDRSPARLARRSLRRGKHVLGRINYPHKAPSPSSIDTYALSADEIVESSYATDTEFGKLFFNHRGRQAHKWTQYFAPYEDHLARYRQGFKLPDGSYRPLRFLEIGVAHGGSLQLWRKYFGPEAVIYGIDIDSRCRIIDDVDLNIRIGSQANRRFLESVVAEMGGVDVVLDDGSHRAEDHNATFRALFPMLSEGGFYIVEDLHTCYWPPYGGGYRRPGTFIEIAKDLVDAMHEWYYDAKSRSHAAPAKTEVYSICFYDSMVFIEKRARPEPIDTKVGEPSY